jgi:transposase
VKGLFNLFAARNVHTGAFHYKFYDFKNSFVVIDMFEHLLKTYPCQDIYIILDNWSCHRSAAVKAFVDLQPRIELVYLPFTASWLNDIERDFSLIEKGVLRNSNFHSVKEGIDAVGGFIENHLRSP